MGGLKSGAPWRNTLCDKNRAGFEPGTKFSFFPLGRRGGLKYNALLHNTLCVCDFFFGGGGGIGGTALLAENNGEGFG